MTAEVTSLTVPVIDARSDCAKTGLAARDNIKMAAAIKTASARMLLNHAPRVLFDVNFKLILPKPHMACGI